MSAITANLGINSYDSGLISRVSTSKKTDVKVIMDYQSNFGAAASIDPLFEATVEGYGDVLTPDVGISSAANPASFDGGVTVITRNESTEKNDDFNSWKIAMKNAPSAS